MNLNRDEIELRSEDVQDIISYIPGWMIRWGNTVIFLLIVLTILFSFLIKYPDTVTSQVIVTTAIPPVHIVSRSEGKLSQLFVTENEHINKEQALAVIENTADYNDVEKLRNTLQHFNLEENPINYQIFEDYNLGELQHDYLSFKEALSNYRLQLKLSPEQKEITAIKKQLAEYQSLSNKQLAKIDNFKDELKLADLDLERTRILFDQKVISLKDYEDKQKQVLQLKREFEDLNIFFDQTKIAISELEKALVLLDIKESQ
nr:hypothetical protein [Bacteroidota bacterium]